MQKIKQIVKSNKVVLILLVLLFANLALYQLTATLFEDNKKVELEKKNQKLSYFESGVYIFNLGHYIVDYFERFSEKN